MSRPEPSDLTIALLYAAAAGVAPWSDALDMLAAHTATLWTSARLEAESGATEEHWGGPEVPSDPSARAAAAARGAASPDALLLEESGVRIHLAVGPGARMASGIDAGAGGDRWGDLAVALAALPAVAAHRTRAAREGAALLAVLDVLDVAVVVVDGHARIRHENRAASTMLDAGEALSRRDGRLGATRPDARDALRRAIEQATGPGATPGATFGPISLPAHAGAPPSIAVVFPARLGEEATPLPLAAVLVSDPEARRLLDAGDAASFAGLTAAEGRVAAALTEGLTSAEVARAIGVSVETVRKQVRALIRKTGAGRQSEAVARLLGARLPLL